MTFWDFLGNHPFLSVVLLFLLIVGVHDTIIAIKS